MGVAMVAMLATSCNKKESSSSNNNLSSNEKVWKVGVSKLLAHPALDAVEKGAKDYLDKTDIKIAWDYQSGSGDISTCSAIAQKFKSEGKDIVLGIATPSAQSLANVFPASSKVPVLFAAVTDPVDAGLVKDWSGDSSSNICGVSDMTPVEDQIKFLADLTKAKTIGMVYTANEANGVVLKNMAESACKKLGLNFVTASVQNTSEVRQATQSIIDRVDAIYIGPDNVVISALASVDDVTTKYNKVLFSADTSNTSGLNCLISWGFNYYSIGKEVGKMIEKITKGENPGSLGAVVLKDPKEFELFINLDTAKKLGITISDELKQTAAVLIENGVSTRK